MLKRRSLLLLGSASLGLGLSGFSGAAPLLQEPSSLETNIPDDRPWLDKHNSLIGAAKSALHNDIAAGLADLHTRRSIECPICCLRLSVNADGEVVVI